MTLQQTAERRPKKIDLNLLPPEYRPAKKSKLSIILALVTVILVCALLPLIIAKAGVDSDIKPMRANLTSLKATLQANSANNQAAEVIEKQIADNVSKFTVMEFDYQMFIATRIIWSAILSEINDLTPKSKIAIATLTLTDTGVKIDGSATKRQYIIDYETDLEASPFFKDVTFSFGDSTAGAMVNFEITAPFDLDYIARTNNPSFNISQ